MKLLIIEDTQKHQAAARVQFPEAVVVNYDEAFQLLHDALPGDYSAILTDLHFKVEMDRALPAAPFTYAGNFEAIGRQLPFGLAFLLKAVELGCPAVLVSDANHHTDLVTAMLDMMGFLIKPRANRAEQRHYLKGAGEGSEAYAWENRIQNPRFVAKLIQCPMSEDMHWDGEKIVLAPMFEGQYDTQVKDWREAHRLLTAVLAES